MQISHNYAVLNAKELSWNEARWNDAQKADSELISALFEKLKS